VVRAGAQHRAVPLLRGRGVQHPRVRAAAFADAGLGLARWRSAQRPAAARRDCLPANQATQLLTTEINQVCKPDKADRCTLYGTNDDLHWKTLGEALFNLGQYDGFASGAYACARCHTLGWSIGMPRVSGGGGGLGPNLTNGSELRTFDTAADQVAFVMLGSLPGKGYGHGGMGSGQMPAWGINPNGSDPTKATMSPSQVMYTQDQVKAIVAYERGL
jgi:hypothetical protein